MSGDILVIEDDKEISGLLGRALLREGYCVKAAFTGIDGMEMLRREAFDLVLLDLMLPFKSGDQVLKEVRTFSEVPVLVISAKETTQNKIDLLRLGAERLEIKNIGVAGDSLEHYFINAIGGTRHD